MTASTRKNWKSGRRLQKLTNVSLKSVSSKNVSDVDQAL